MRGPTLFSNIRAVQIKLMTPLSITLKASCYLDSSRPSFLWAADTWLVTLEVRRGKNPQEHPAEAGLWLF